MPLDRPRLRPHFSAQQNGQTIVLHDRCRLTPPVPVNPLQFELLRRCDGSRTVADLARSVPGVNLPVGDVSGFIDQLDQLLAFDSPALDAHLSGPIRRPSCVGVYPADPTAARTQLDTLFTAAGGPGLPSVKRDPVRAVLVPHMDYARGNVTYGWGFQAIAERTDAKLFVIVATSHYSPARFTLTRQHFQTPLGVAETDHAYLDRIEAAYGPGLYEDRFAHLPEHSIELEVVLLQHLYPDRPIRIVPLLVGSFRDCVEANRSPSEFDDIARMVAALKAAEAAAGEPVCYVISGDLAHIGPKFDDPDPVDAKQLAASKSQDDKLLARLGAADASGYFDAIAAEGDQRNICGLPPTWLTLAVTGATRGEVLHYQQFADPTGYESVSFAAAAFC